MGTTEGKTVKLSNAQKRMLERIPDEWTRWKRHHGMPFLLLNPTLDCLRRHGLAEIDTAPPRWKRTAAGSAALARARHPGETP